MRSRGGRNGGGGEDEEEKEEEDRAGGELASSDSVITWTNYHTAHFHRRKLVALKKQIIDLLLGWDNRPWKNRK